MQRQMPDLTDGSSTYEENFVPDADIIICLKVIRTVRNLCLDPNVFDAEGAVLLSHAHAKLLTMAEECWTPEQTLEELKQNVTLEELKANAKAGADNQDRS